MIAGIVAPDIPVTAGTVADHQSVLQGETAAGNDDAVSGILIQGQRDVGEGHRAAADLQGGLAGFVFRNGDVIEMGGPCFRIKGGARTDHGAEGGCLVAENRQVRQDNGSVLLIDRAAEQRSIAVQRDRRRMFRIAAGQREFAGRIDRAAAAAPVRDIGTRIDRTVQRRDV